MQSSFWTDMALAKNSIIVHEGRIKLKDNNSVNHSFIATKKKKRKERKHGQVQNNRVGKDEQLLKKCTASLGKKYLKGMTLEVFVQKKKFYVFNSILTTPIQFNFIELLLITTANITFTVQRKLVSRDLIF